MLRKPRLLLAGFVGAIFLAMSFATVANSADYKPVATRNPSVSASTTLPGYLQGGAGRWSRAKTYKYQWYSCTKKHTSATKSRSSDCTAISGATAKTYKVTTASLTRYLQFAVTGKNKYGLRNSYSATVRDGVTYPSKASTTTYTVAPQTKFDFSNDWFLAAARSDCTLTIPGSTSSYGSLLANVSVTSG